MKICENCKNSIEDDAMFCQKCGSKISLLEPLSETPITTKEEKEVKKSIKKQILSIIGGILFLVLMFGIIWYNFSDEITNFNYDSKSEQYDNTLSFKEQYELGMKYLSEGNYEDAIIAFKAAIELEPKNSEAYIALADVYIAMEDYEMAISTLENAITLIDDEDLVLKREEIENLISNNDKDTKISWEDETMEVMIRLAINKPDGEITPEDLDEITELYIYGELYAITTNPTTDASNIQSSLNILSTYTQNIIDGKSVGSFSTLSDLQQFENLTTLFITLCKIEDLSSIASLTNLTSLSLVCDDISDISDLAQLTNLERLSLSYNNISDISPLSNLSKLTYLDLNIYITDWSPVSHVETVVGRPTQTESTVTTTESYICSTEPLELSIFLYDGSAFDIENNLTIFEDYFAYTNILLKSTTDSALSDPDVEFHLMLMKPTLPDIVCGFSNDVVVYGDIGAFFPLDDLIDGYAPNIKAKFDQYPELKDSVTGENGDIYAIPLIFDAVSADENISSWAISVDNLYPIESLLYMDFYYSDIGNELRK